MKRFTRPGRFNYQGEITVICSEGKTYQAAGAVGKTLSKYDDIDINPYSEFLGNGKEAVTFEVSFSQSTRWEHIGETRLDPPEDSFNPEPLTCFDIETEIEKALPDYEIDEVCFREPEFETF